MGIDVWFVDTLPFVAGLEGKESSGCAQSVRCRRNWSLHVGGIDLLDRLATDTHSCLATCPLSMTSSTRRLIGSHRNKRRSARPRRSLLVRNFREARGHMNSFLLTGNITVGNLHHFLPLVVKMVDNDQEKRLLSLHAIKEVGWLVLHVYI